MAKKRIDVKTEQIGIRIPQATAHDIDVLIRNGFYKDRSDFVYQATLDYLDVTKKKLAGRIIELEMPIPSREPSRVERSRTEGQRP